MKIGYTRVSTDDQSRVLQRTALIAGNSDADTLTLLTEQKQPIRIHHSDIDASERRYLDGTTARETLSDKKSYCVT